MMMRPRWPTVAGLKKVALLGQPTGGLFAFQFAGSIMADETVTRGEAATVPYRPTIER